MPTARASADVGLIGLAVMGDGDDDQIVPVADSAPLSAKLLRKGTLKVYEKFPHDTCTTHADVINADLLAFIKS
jgi:non-heme chloroperoxidase